MTGHQLALLMLDVVSDETQSLGRESDEETIARMWTWMRNRDAFMKLAVLIPGTIPAVFDSRASPPYIIDCSPQQFIDARARRLMVRKSKWLVVRNSKS